jgi:hypothetical protein
VTETDALKTAVATIILQPKQFQLLKAIMNQKADAASVIGFGGSRGAAKSGGARRVAILLADAFPGVTIWIIRRVWDDLNKDHVLEMWREFPDFQQFYHAGEKKIVFPNKSTIFFIHAGIGGRAKRKARGPQAHFIFLEQAEEFTEEEMTQLAGSNRAPGYPSNFCKRIFTFNPGGIGTAYLRRVMWRRIFNENETPSDFMFIQGYGWDNYEWFRGLGIVDQVTFYDEWTDEQRFECFIRKTDFGKKLNGLPPGQRIGELMGSFEKMAGQYFSEVWDQELVVLPQDLVSRIIQPWWRRWLATDWGFSHYAATGWFASGLLSPADCLGYFGIETTMPVRIIIQYREFVGSDIEEPLLAQTIAAKTPDTEKREIRDHWMGHDAWAKRGSANTVVEQMEPILRREGMPVLSHADIDRIGGWRLMYNCLASARRFRKWSGTPYIEKPEDQPMFFVSAACPDTVDSIPLLMCDSTDDPDGNPLDVRKDRGKMHDDVGDMVRYGLKSYLRAQPKAPREVIEMETYQRYQDPTARAMAILKLRADSDSGQYIRRRPRA